MVVSRIVLTLICLAVHGQEIRTTAKDRVGLGATFYQNGLAVVRDTRRIDLPAGRSRLAFADLLPTLRPKSAVLLASTWDVQALERNYEFDVLSPGSLVRSSLGLPVWIHDQGGAWDKTGLLASLPLLYPAPRIDAAQLAQMGLPPRTHARPPDSRVVVLAKDGYQIASPETLAISRVPPGLRPSPTLLQDVLVPSAGPRELTLVYAATDLTWTASYVVTLDTDGQHLDLVVLATVENRADGSLPKASLQLVAGEPNLVPDEPPSDPEETDEEKRVVVVVAASIAGPPAFKEDQLEEYPLFTLDRPVSILGHAKKQLLLMQVPHVPVAQSFLVQVPYMDYENGGAWEYLNSETFQPEPVGSGASPLPCLEPIGDGTPGSYPLVWQHAYMTAYRREQWLARHRPPVQRVGHIRNDREHKLGRALPSGSLDLRYRDPQGLEIPLPEALGAEAQFPATPPGADLELLLGPARGFDVERRPIGSKVMPGGKTREEGERGIALAYTLEVQVASRLPKASMVTIREPVHSDATLLHATHPGVRSGTHAFDFMVEVPAHGKAVLRYTVQTQPLPPPTETTPD